MPCFPTDTGSAAAHRRLWLRLTVTTTRSWSLGYVQKTESPFWLMQHFKEKPSQLRYFMEMYLLGHQDLQKGKWWEDNRDQKVKSPKKTPNLIRAILQATFSSTLSTSHRGEALTCKNCFPLSTRKSKLKRFLFHFPLYHRPSLNASEFMYDKFGITVSHSS